MHFGNRQWYPVPVPCLTQQRLYAAGRDSQTARGFDVGITVAAIPPVKALGIVRSALVEKALARDVVVRADHIGPAIVLCKPQQVSGQRAAALSQPFPKWMTGSQAAAKQVP
jgi:hypothetical protein